MSATSWSSRTTTRESVPSRSRRTGVAAPASWNRRCSPAPSRGRLRKGCAVHDPAPVEIVTWAAETQAEECNRTAETIQRLHAAAGTSSCLGTSLALLERLRPFSAGQESLLLQRG